MSTDEKSPETKVGHKHKFLHDGNEIPHEQAAKMITEFYGEEKAADVIEGLTATPPKYSGAVHKTGRITCVKIVALLMLTMMLSFSARASLVSSNLYSLSSLATTNVGPVVVLGTAYLPPMTFFFQNLGLPTTNAFTGQIQMSLGSDTNYFATVAVYSPSSTNAIREAFTMPSQSVTIYCRVRLISTNANSVGADVTLQQ